jgi:transcription initiation factor TFIIE subunit alpha
MSEHKKLMRMTVRAFYATSYAKERLNRTTNGQPSTTGSVADLAHLNMLPTGSTMTPPPIVGPKAPTVDKKTKLDDPRIVEVVVDALTRRTWTREDDLASDLKLSFKQCRKLLTYLEREKLVTRAHVREKDRARAAALAERGITDAPEVKKTVSWCSLNYGRLLDVVRFRLLLVKKRARAAVDKGKVHEVYVCVGPEEECGRTYSSLDAAALLDPMEMVFKCANCGCEVKQAGRDGAPEPEGAARETKESLQRRYDELEKQFKPLEAQLAKAMKTPAPLYGTLTEWAVARKRYAQNKGGGGGAGGRRGGAALDAHLEETKFVVELGSTAEEQEKQAELDAIKVQPEWVTRNQFEKEDAAAEEEGADAKAAKDGKTDGKSAADSAMQEQYLQALLSALQKQQSEVKVEEDATAKEAEAEEIAQAVDDLFGDDMDEWEDA